MSAQPVSSSLSCCNDVGHPSIGSWDPIAILSIANPDRGGELTCVGYAHSCRRRCRNPINMYNRSSAWSIIDKLGLLDPAVDDLKPLLRQLAKLTLCLRYHQDQVDSVTREWLAAVNATIRHTVNRHASAAFRVRNPDVHNPVVDISTGIDVVAMLQGILRQQEAERARRQAAEAAERCARAEVERLRQEAERREREVTEHREHVEAERRERVEAERREREDTKRCEREEVALREREEADRRERVEAEHRERDTEEQIRKAAEQERCCKEQDKLAEHIRRCVEALKQERRQPWNDYNEAWEDFDDKKKIGSAAVDDLRWPVKSGSFLHVTAEAVRAFYNQALQLETPEKRRAMMRREAMRWHPDRLTIIRAQGEGLAAINLIMGIVSDLWKVIDHNRPRARL